MEGKNLEKNGTLKCCNITIEPIKPGHFLDTVILANNNQIFIDVQVLKDR
jgi:hypothetical protein